MFSCSKLLTENDVWCMIYCVLSFLGFQKVLNKFIEFFAILMGISLPAISKSGSGYCERRKGCYLMLEILLELSDFTIPSYSSSISSWFLMRWDISWLNKSFASEVSKLRSKFVTCTTKCSLGLWNADKVCRELSSM